MAASIQVVNTAAESFEQATQTARLLGVDVLERSTPDADYALLFNETGVCLAPTVKSSMAPIRVDFTQGGAAHRRKFGGGSGQMIAKAVGLLGSCKPRVVDATAGLGGDGFVLATLGCQVTLFERSPVAYALLADGLRRARIFAEREDVQLLEILQRMELRSGDSIAYLADADTPAAQVVYLDPMFPERVKSAAVKKEMSIFHALLGTDADDTQLLAAALAKAEFRVAVKRPRTAPAIGLTPPNLILEGKSCRYDIYTRKKITLAALSAI